MTPADVTGLVLRIVLGITIAAHGYNHLFGPGGLEGTARWFGSIGLQPARVHAFLSGWGELLAGIALVLGALTSLAAAFVVGTMVVAGITAHRKNGFFVFKDGYEYTLLIASAVTSLAILGPGAVSLDRSIGIASVLNGGVGALIAAGGGVVGAALLLGVCWRPARLRPAENSAEAASTSQ